jgi:hypothetical protein
MAKQSKKVAIADYAGLTVGAVAAAKVSSIKLPINLPPAIQAVLPLLLGVMLSRKPGFVGSIGKGMIAVGGTKLLGAVAPGLGVGAADGEETMEALITGTDTYALAGATDGTVGATTYALAGVDQPDGNMFG